MDVHAVVYHNEDVSEELYLSALARVPVESQTRIKQFYRRDDACRTLIGELLIRLLLLERGVSRPAFAKTTGGKPYLLNQDPENCIGFNVTHDNSLVALASSRGIHNPPAFSVGVDVMKTQIPNRESFLTFMEPIEGQLTTLELGLLTSDISSNERIRRFFWMWTLKEAYTKALGLGLGFDFKRVEFNVVEKQVMVDGSSPKGWRFTMFTARDQDDLYEGVVAEFIGGDTTEVLDRSNEIHPPWLKITLAPSVLRRAVEMLASTDQSTAYPFDCRGMS